MKKTGPESAVAGPSEPSVMTCASAVATASNTPAATRPPAPALAVMTPLLSSFELARDATGSAHAATTKMRARESVQHSTLAHARPISGPHRRSTLRNGRAQRPYASSSRAPNGEDPVSMIFRASTLYAGIMSLALLVSACGGGGGGGGGGGRSNRRRNRRRLHSQRADR